MKQLYNEEEEMGYEIPLDVTRVKIRMDELTAGRRGSVRGVWPPPHPTPFEPGTPREECFLGQKYSSTKNESTNWLKKLIFFDILVFIF